MSKLKSFLLMSLVVVLAIVGVLCIVAQEGVTEGPIQDGWGCPIGPGIIEGTWEPYKADPFTVDFLGTMIITPDRLIFENHGVMEYVRKRMTKDEVIPEAPRTPKGSGAYLQIINSDVGNDGIDRSAPFVGYAYPSQTPKYKREDCVLGLYFCSHKQSLSRFLYDENGPDLYCGDRKSVV